MDFDAIKQGQRAMWSAGDYGEISRMIASVGALVAERAHAAEGVRLLDVATGTGNVAIPAALAGASVTGLDLTPRLLETARERAVSASARIEFVEGDAEALPFEDGSFDAVTSCFGVMFAPRHELAARELVRVARPGGRIVVSAWTPEGVQGRMFKTVGAYMPPPPPDLQPPLLWGTEEHVSELFPEDADVEFERCVVRFEHDSPESFLDYNERNLGPSVMARAALEPQGRWEALHEEVLELYRESNEAGDGRFSAQAEYLLSVITLPA